MKRWLRFVTCEPKPPTQKRSAPIIPPQFPSATYRPEIDGLRAIAVLSVVLYHFGLPGLGGGFVGVDVFFVLSGFLIGGILWRDYSATGRLSLARFYTRRVKRLAPAYFTVAAASALVSYLVLLPFEFREFGKSLIAATLYLSNVLFYQSAGYFDIASENKVLLHTWSLSVEEQFYVILPLAIVLLRKFRRALLALLVFGFAASLIANIVVTPHAQTAAFYLFPFRAWELLAGVLLAIWGETRRANWRVHAGLSWVGIAMIIGAILWIDPTRGFPGWQAIFPVFGTVLILANGRHNNPVNRALSLRIPVFIGMISYSLYLWHWPVLTLSTYWRDGYSGAIESAAWLGLAVVLSVLTWRFIERPMRHMDGPRGWRILVGLATPTIIMLAIGAAAYIKNGAPGRFAPNVRIHIDASADFLQDWSRCEIAPNGPFAGIEICPIGPDGPPRVLIWGDSHVRAFKEGLEQAAFETDTPGLLIWHAGCPPLFNIKKRESAATRAQDTKCHTDTAQIRKGVAQLESVERVLLIGRWAYYANGAGVGLDAHNTIELSGPHDENNAANADIFAHATVATVAELLNYFKEVHVLRQAPEIPNYDSRNTARHLAHGRTSNAQNTKFSVSRTALPARTALSETPWRALAKNGVIKWIDPYPMMCSADKCGAIHDTKLGIQGWYFDNNHITNAASRVLRGLFVPFLTGAKP